MDASFDQFGGSGWGEHGGGGQEFATTSHQKSHLTDKIPIPALVEDLLTMSNDDEKFVIGGYTFNTVSLFIVFIKGVLWIFGGYILAVSMASI